MIVGADRIPPLVVAEFLLSVMLESDPCCYRLDILCRRWVSTTYVVGIWSSPPLLPWSPKVETTSDLKKEPN
ncbi:hypothetical protein ACLOJK_024010 [Asimina triloba]